MLREHQSDYAPMIHQGRAAQARASTRILLVDDQIVFRAGLRALLELQRDFVVVGEAGRGEQAVVRAKQTRPDLVLMDLAMPGQGGLEATRQIVALGMGIRVLVLTALARERELLDALEAGARGFIEKTEPAEGILRAIRTVAADGLFLGAEAAKLVVLQRYQRHGQLDDENAGVNRLLGRYPASTGSNSSGG